jgi:hypothetical protein
MFVIAIDIVLAIDKNIDIEFNAPDALWNNLHRVAKRKIL